MADRKAGSARAAAIADQMAHLRSVTAPEPADEAEAPKPKRAARPRKVEQAPAEQKPQTDWKRIPFMTDTEQHRALATARLEDGIEATTRLRAMVKLWMENEQFRKRVDRLAAEDRLRDRLARGYRR
jgi:glucose/arabinose dehydrogenase